MRGMNQIKISQPTVSDLYNDIEQRNMLMGTRVGSLYPLILQAEVNELYEMIRELKYHDHVHEFYTVKDFSAHEILTKNIIWIAVVLNRCKICKKCGYKENSDS